MSFKEIIIELTVSNIYNSINFYTEIFGFNIEITDGDPYTWVQLNKDGQKIMLENYMTVTNEIKNYPLKTETSNIIKFELDSIEELNIIYKKCQNKKCEFFMDYTKTDYGASEFGIYDLDKNLIIVSYREDI